jgi:ABC-type polar amino acid transport system ATPase subunit
VIRNLAAEGMTMILVTHEMAFAADVSNRVGFMSEGVMAEIGVAADVIHRPQNPFTAGRVPGIAQFQRVLTPRSGIRKNR